MTPRDATATRERIVAAAADEFAEHGFAGARVDAIATRADCNKALLYQYVGDKEALYREVLQCKMGEISRITDAAGIDLVAVAGSLFDFHAGAPWFSRLLQWESLDFPVGGIPNEDERRARFAEHLDRIRTAQAAGLVDPKLDPRHLLFTIISLTVFWFTAPQLARLIFDEDVTGPAATADRREHLLEITRRIMEER